MKRILLFLKEFREFYKFFQKTDKNEALAIVQAALLPDITFISGKSVEQQQLQSILRLRELCVKQKNSIWKPADSSFIGI